MSASRASDSGLRNLTPSSTNNCLYQCRFTLSPDFTTCFQKSFATSDARHRDGSVPKGALYWTKITLLYAILVVSAIVHGHSLLSVVEPAPVDIFAAIMELCTLTLLILLTELEHREDRMKAAKRMRRTRTTGVSAVLLISYLLWIFAQAALLRTEVLIVQSDAVPTGFNNSGVPRVASMLAVLVLVFVLENFDIRMQRSTNSAPSRPTDEERRLLLDDAESANTADDDEDIGPGTPEEEATLWSHATFSWLDPLMYIGFTRVLVAEDVPDLKTEDTAEVAVKEFLESWEKEVARVGYDIKAPRLVQPPPVPWYRRIFTRGPAERKPTREPSLGRALFGAALLKFVNDNQTNDGTGRPNVEIGVYIAIGLFIMGNVQALMFHQYMIRALGVGVWIRSSMCSAVYQKALVLSVAARTISSSGEITNLMATDAQRLSTAMVHVHYLWSAPLQIIIALVLLYQQLGPSLFGGLFVMVAATPVNIWTASVQDSFSDQQMKLRDERIKVMDELLGAIKVIKLYAWERLFVGKVEKVREAEIALRRNLTWTTTPFFVSLIAFGIHAFFEKEPLTSTKIFVSLNLFNLLTFPLSFFPIVLSGVIQARVSLGRLNKFLLNDEIDRDAVKRTEAPLVAGPFHVPMVTIRNGSFAWSTEPTPVSQDSTDPSAASTPVVTGEPATQEVDGQIKIILSDINITLNSGETVAVVGRVGSGKSSLVNGILGEMKKLSGDVEIRGSVAYVSQVAWIMNATLRENVVFGNVWDSDWYDAVINACALRSDFAILPGGDLTEIGERGINLSGGQRQRVNLARAVYARADVYLLDDPLSAVDAHVGQHIFEEVVGRNGLLATKTRLFVTHGIHFLPECDNILMIEDGKIIARGKHEELLAQSASVRENVSTTDVWSYAELVRDLEKKEVEQVEDDDSDEETMDEGDIPVDSESDVVDATKPSSRRRASTPGPLSTSRRKSSALARSKAKDEQAAKDREKMSKIIEKEELRAGGVSLSTYLAYVRACGVWNLALFILISLVTLLFQVAEALWLADWSRAGDAGTDDGGPRYRIGVYAALGLGQVTFTVMSAITMMMLCAIRASLLLHKNMLENIMKSPQSFFDQTPLGRILNRFSKDMEMVDEQIPQTLSGLVFDVLQVIIAISINVWIMPSLIFVVVPVMVGYVYVGAFYLAAAREMQRLDSSSKSPIYAFFSETLGGLPVVRAFKRSDSFVLRITAFINANARAWYRYIGSNRWIAIRLEFLGSLFMLSATSSAVLAVYFQRNIPTSTIGFALIYAINMSDLLLMVVREGCDVETNIIAVERIIEYSEIPSEAPHYLPDRTPPKAWPDKGEVVFANYSTRYRGNLPVVLNNISVKIAPSQRCGLVGRTGSGKSSLALSLFRVIEPVSGSIVIDGVDISTIGLHDLRSRITIIPQESLLFAGTMRENLDPFGERTDLECWKALEASGLGDAVKAMDGKLDHVIQPGGENISVGQRQLVCLARALLRRTKVLVLDEATASVDKQTDDFIQETIRKEFSDCTIITIAHRIGTIMDYDRILVLGPQPPEPGGHVLEWDHPSRLLENTNGTFYKFAKDAGLVGKSSESRIREGRREAAGRST
ncbi:hypothetical protein HDU93_000441 [Gonapodya sp. JEL0774]|nr:hypothetical protein HDU93_000441 [Gonapodya sp. JEL0774]